MNNKRSHHEAYGHHGAHHHQQHKKHKQNHFQDRKGKPHNAPHPREEKPSAPSIPFDEALSRIPEPTCKLGHIPPYTHFTVTPGVPPLPEIHSEPLRSAPFQHKSLHPIDRSVAPGRDVTYEKLEFLGDAQLEHIASRLIYERYSFLPAGQQSQLRELLVKNETLSEYARLYHLDRRVQVADMERMQQDAKDRGNKGFNKVLGDVFEAYLAAVIIDHGDEGFAVGEKWMTALWAPKLVEAGRVQRFDRLAGGGGVGGPADGSFCRGDVLEVYDPTAKIELQKRIIGSPDVKLEYEPYKASVELKGDMLGQNQHFIALYLTGYGYERKLLGKGEGKSKVEAGNWAATRAMHAECKEIVDECEKVMLEKRAIKKAERAKKDAERKAGLVGEDQKGDEESSSQAKVEAQ